MTRTPPGKPIRRCRFELKEAAEFRTDRLEGRCSRILPNIQVKISFSPSTGHLASYSQGLDDSSLVSIDVIRYSEPNALPELYAVLRQLWRIQASRLL